MRITFIGPATVHLASWTRAFQDAGVVVSVVTCHRAVDFATDVPLLQLTSRLPRRLNLLGQVASMRRSLAARNPDLVVAYYASSYGLIASLVSDCPYVVVTAGSDVNLEAGGRSYLAPLVRRALGHAAAVVCWSDTMKDAVLRFRVPQEKVMVLPRGIDTERFVPPATRRPSDGILRMVCLRRFRPIFHHATLIDACRLLRDRGVQFHLTLCGAGAERGAIEARILHANLGNRVEIIGHLRNEDVPDVLRGADLYVALPEVDGASASLFEAMSAGLYPVVSDIPSNRQWIQDGRNGTLVNYEDASAVATAIERAAEPTFRQAAIERNLEFARLRLDIRINTRKFVAFFSDVVREAEMRAHGTAAPTYDPTDVRQQRG